MPPLSLPSHWKSAGAAFSRGKLFTSAPAIVRIEPAHLSSTLPSCCSDSESLLPSPLGEKMRYGALTATEGGVLSTTTFPTALRPVLSLSSHASTN